MSDELVFEGYGRELQAEFDSVGDSSFANAAKDLVAWFSGDGFANGLWRVNASKSDQGASLAFVLVEADAFVAPVFPQAVETAPEQTAAQVEAQAAAAAPDVAPAADAAAVVPAPDAPVAEVAPADPPVAASSETSSEPQNTSSADPGDVTAAA